MRSRRFMFVSATFGLTLPYRYYILRMLASSGSRSSPTWCRYEYMRSIAPCAYINLALCFILLFCSCLQELAVINGSSGRCLQAFPVPVAALLLPNLTKHFFRPGTLPLIYPPTPPHPCVCVCVLQLLATATAFVTPSLPQITCTAPPPQINFQRRL